MDPVSLDKLLSVMDAVEERREGNRLRLSIFNQIVAEQTQAKKMLRRQRDILRVLLASGWLTEDGEILCLTPTYTELVSLWNRGDLLGIGNRLRDYSPFSHFLGCLRKERVIRLPDRHDEDAWEDLILDLKAKGYDITLVGFDTFCSWALAVGQAYLSPFEQALYWGGEWDNERPSLDLFKSTCRIAYSRAEKSSGYASIGWLADTVCRNLYISFHSFEVNLNVLAESEPDLFTLSPATIRLPSRLFRIVVIRPRAEVIKERLAAQLRGEERKHRPRWTEHRYLEDGVYVSNRLVKLIRWEVSDDNQG